MVQKVAQGILTPLLTVSFVVVRAEHGAGRCK